MSIDSATQARIDTWLAGPYDPATKQEIQEMLATNPKKAIDAFYTTLKFGTGGLRGIVGVGSNRMNRYTVQATTQGLANYLKKTAPSPSIVIGYDSRTHSRTFAEQAAQVLAGNGIKVHLFFELRPTPLISFACRHLKASGAIMITASHNPPEYNGYKVYNSDGGQVIPPDDIGIINEVNKITGPDQVTTAPLNSPLISTLGEELDAAYLKACHTLQHYPVVNKKQGGKLSIVYSSLHGTGITLVPKILSDWGFSKLTLVPKQCDPDGTFPTVSYPNPEEIDALKLGMESLKAAGGDIFMATDPDADRVGVVVRHQGKLQLINGNQLACILLEHVCRGLTDGNRMPEWGAFVKTISTTELFRAICASWNKPCFDTLTGFKYIASLIRSWEQGSNGYEFLFGGEESYGYLLGSFVHDKDAVVICALIAEAALHAKLEGKTLIDRLHELYHKHGIYLEKLEAIRFEESKEGREKMAQMVERLQKSPPHEILGVKVESLEDYSTGERLDLNTGKRELLDFPKSDALLLWLADGTKVLIRPSGTEPKVKIYCGVRQEKFESIESGLRECEERIDAIIEALKK